LLFACQHRGGTTMSTVNHTRRFRELISQPGCLIQPAVFNPLSAKIAQACGFEAICLGGYAMGAGTAITEPLMSLEEVAQMVRSVRQVTDLPLMVDAGAGWGDPLHVMRTVRVLEQAGASSIHIEDQYFPKRARYHMGVEEVISQDEMVLKIRAACQARKDPDFVIVARTDAMRTHGYEEGVRRCNAYVEAGADMIMIFPDSDEDTIRARKDIPDVPLVYVNSTGNKFNRGVYTREQLDRRGYKVLYDAISSINVVAKTLFSYYTHLHRTGEHGLDNAEMVQIRAQVEKAIGLEDMYRLEQETIGDIHMPKNAT